MDPVKHIHKTVLQLTGLIARLQPGDEVMAECISLTEEIDSTASIIGEVLQKENNKLD